MKFNQDDKEKNCIKMIESRRTKIISLQKSSEKINGYVY